MRIPPTSTSTPNVFQQEGNHFDKWSEASAHCLYATHVVVTFYDSMSCSLPLYETILIWYFNNINVKRWGRFCRKGLQFAKNNDNMKMIVCYKKFSPTHAVCHFRLRNDNIMKWSLKIGIQKERTQLGWHIGSVWLVDGCRPFFKVAVLHLSQSQQAQK